MTGGPHIWAVGPEAAQDATVVEQAQAGDEPVMLLEEWTEEVSDPAHMPHRRIGDWLVPTLALMAIAGWTAFFGWALRGELSLASSPQAWISAVIDWTVPVLLVATLWLLAMRLSHREASRFGDAALLLRQESQALETRLAIVNRELSLAREFLGSQSRELESLGRIASERISAHAQSLQSLIQSNGAQVEAIASVSDTAMINMGKLRDDLPVIANSARDVSNQIGQAGRTAQEQLEKLVLGFERLNEFGKASGRQVGMLSEQIETTLTRFETQLEQIEQMTEGRFAVLAEKSEAFRVELDGREIDALAAMRARADELRGSIADLAAALAQQGETGLAALKSQIEHLRDNGTAVATSLQAVQDSAVSAFERHRERLDRDIAAIVTRIDQLDQHAVAAGRRRMESFVQEGDEIDARMAARDAQFAESVARRQDEFDTREAQASEILAQRLAELDDMLAERQQAQIAQLQQLVEQGGLVAAKAEDLGELLVSISAQAEQAQARLGDGMGQLSDKLSHSRGELTATGQSLNELTEAGIRLLEIIQSGARETREALPRAIDQAAARLSELESRATELKGTVVAANAQGSGLNDYVIAARQNVAQASEDLDGLQQRLAQNAADTLALIATLREAVGALGQDSERVATRSGEDLSAAILQLEAAARDAYAAIEAGANGRIEQLAGEIGARAAAAIERSLEAESGAAVARLEAATARATGAGRETAAALREQLARVNELAANLEQRVARARELAQEQVDNDFARRMALITESLNSNAIDITKALSSDVTDTAWTSYLKGDRGIFTRRAVRLVDNAEAREILELYETDTTFRDHVSRYIHDFESMLRTVLSTRDGNALGVTLLSSDMGKLYVALAQAIERLRD